MDEASNSKKMRVSRINSQEEMTVQIKRENRDGLENLGRLTGGHALKAPAGF